MINAPTIDRRVAGKVSSQDPLDNITPEIAGTNSDGMRKILSNRPLIVAARWCASLLTREDTFKFPKKLSVWASHGIDNTGEGCVYSEEGVDVEESWLLGEASLLKWSSIGRLSGSKSRSGGEGGGGGGSRCASSFLFDLTRVL